MNILDTLSKILDCSIGQADLRFCFVDAKKLPFRTDGLIAKPNKCDDFVDLETLIQSENINSYSGIGISIQASNVCAIDVDHCFSVPCDVSSISKSAEHILELFKNCAYCEFSFSGTGLRILFKAPIIEDYSSKYYIKNTEIGVEYYQPSTSFRYVTVTGNTISDNPIADINVDVLLTFLDTFMKRPCHKSTSAVNVTSMTDNECMNKIQYMWFTNSIFRNLWFDPAPGSGSNESERDYQLIAYLYENVTQNKEQLKRLFEMSTFFKTKDKKHMYKWTQQEYRYFNYVFDSVVRSHT